MAFYHHSLSWWAKTDRLKTDRLLLWGSSPPPLSCPSATNQTSCVLQPLLVTSFPLISPQLPAIITFFLVIEMDKCDSLDRRKKRRRKDGLMKRASYLPHGCGKAVKWPWGPCVCQNQQRAYGLSALVTELALPITGTSTFAPGYCIRGCKPMRTLEKLKMWVTSFWNVLPMGQGLNSWPSPPLKQLWLPCRFWTQGEKVVVSRKAYLNWMDGSGWYGFAGHGVMQLPSSASSL